MHLLDKDHLLHPQFFAPSAPPQFSATTQFSAPPVPLQNYMAQAILARYNGMSTTSMNGSAVLTDNCGVTPAYGLYGGYQSSGWSNDGSSRQQPWHVDSGATNHITNNLGNITQPRPSSLNSGVLVGNGTQLFVTHTGSGQIPNSTSSK